jgi:multisubunit Na+/H+ antiporter MnhB subunit
MLVLTNRRIIAFGQTDGMRQTVLLPVEEVKAVAINVGHRSKGALFQGGLMVVAAVFLYVLLAYWLTGRIDGPTVPIIRMDLVAFVVFLAVLTGVAMLAQVYFAKPDGEVTFQGDGVKLTFPFRGDTAEADMYQVVNSAFASRQTIVGDSSVITK